MGLMFCILLLASFVNGGVYEAYEWLFAKLLVMCVSSSGDAGDSLVLLVCKHAKINILKMLMLQFSTINYYFLSDSFKTPSVYYMHHSTFANYLAW